MTHRASRPGMTLDLDDVTLSYTGTPVVDGRCP